MDSLSGDNHSWYCTFGTFKTVYCAQWVFDQGHVRNVGLSSSYVSSISSTYTLAGCFCSSSAEGHHTDECRRNPSTRGGGRKSHDPHAATEREVNTCYYDRVERSRIVIRTNVDGSQVHAAAEERVAILAPRRKERTSVCCGHRKERSRNFLWVKSLAVPEDAYSDLRGAESVLQRSTLEICIAERTLNESYES